MIGTATDKHHASRFILLLWMIAAGSGCHGVMAVQDAPDHIELSSLRIDDALSIRAIQLIEVGAAVRLLSSTTGEKFKGFPGYETVITAWSIPAGRRIGASLFEIPQLLPPPPEWEVVVNSDGSYLAVAESAGGALNALLVCSPTGEQRPVTGKYALESFGRPHFIVRRRSDRDTSISAISDNTQLVVFRGQRSSDYGDYTKVVDCSEAVIVEYPNGYGLFYKTPIAGPARDDVQPGLLRYAPLGRNFLPAESSTKPFADKAVFEFAVDLIGDDVAVFATTEAGAALMISPLSEESFKQVPLQGDYDGKALSQPRIRATKSHLYVAGMEFARTGKARVLVGAAPIDAIR